VVLVYTEGNKRERGIYMNNYEQTIMDRAYQSYVTGGDSYTFNYPVGKKAFERAIYVETIEKLEKDGMLEIVSVGEKRMRLRLTDKGIDYGNRQGL
jgi:hypothetical protein